MSLVGSLEDLGLVDILQIVSLSRKSGVLFLRAENGEGRIVLREGLVQGATIKGGPESVRDLLRASGQANESQVECAESLAHDDSLSEGERVCEVGESTLEELKREQVQTAVMLMFGWRNGEFSFEIGDETAPEDLPLLLTTGLNTQYLAMEATRLGDEGSAPPDLIDAPDASGPPLEAEELLFSGDMDEAASADEAVFAGADASDDDDDASAAAEALQVAAGPPAVETKDAEPVASAREGAVAEGTPASPPTFEARYLIVIDPDLSGLEWFKASVEPMFQRVHIFQRCGSAIDRIRQYLVRGVVPIVVIAETCAENDRDAVRIVPRLRSLSSSISVLTLRTEGAPGEPSPEVDGAVVRPASPTGDPDRWHLYESHAERLRDDLEPWLASGRGV